MSATAASLAGGYRITLVNAAGPRAAGAMALGSADGPVPNAAGARYVLEGAMQAPLDSLGAVMPAGVQPRDARVVGVASGTSLTLRLESAPATAGQPAVEGAYLALTVHRATAGEIAGAWRSGNGQREVARGHFCAVRLPG